MRRNDKPGADPFLRASNVVPDMMEKGYSREAEDAGRHQQTRTCMDRRTGVCGLMDPMRLLQVLRLIPCD